MKVSRINFLSKLASLSIKPYIKSYSPVWEHCFQYVLQVTPSEPSLKSAQFSFYQLFMPPKTHFQPNWMVSLAGKGMYEVNEVK